MYIFINDPGEIKIKICCSYTGRASSCVNRTVIYHHVNVNVAACTHEKVLGYYTGSVFHNVCICTGVRKKFYPQSTLLQDLKLYQ